MRRHQAILPEVGMFSGNFLSKANFDCAQADNGPGNGVAFDYGVNFLS
jgi:hypothetical protein